MANRKNNNLLVRILVFLYILQEKERPYHQLSNHMVWRRRINPWNPIVWILIVPFILFVVLITGLKEVIPQIPSTFKWQ